MPAMNAVEDPAGQNGMEEELADLAVDLLLLSQELINTKIKLETLSKTGWIEMAKARYIMGPSAVSALQLPSAEQGRSVKAAIKVDHSECLRSGGSVRYHYFSLSFQACPAPSPSASPLRDMPDGLRLRKKEEARSTAQDVEAEGNTEAEDPIRWFGFMPPQPLKLTQKCFRSCVETVLEIANIQSEIRGVQDRMKFINRRRNHKTTNQGQGTKKDDHNNTNQEQGTKKDPNITIEQVQGTEKDVTTNQSQKPAVGGQPLEVEKGMEDGREVEEVVKLVGGWKNFGVDLVVNEANARHDELDSD